LITGGTVFFRELAGNLPVGETEIAYYYGAGVCFKYYVP
jgi:hypothetical protein